MANAPQNKPGGFGRTSRTLSLWVLAILVPFVFFQMTSGRSEQSPEIDYSIYDAQLSADNIARVTIIGGREVIGEFKNGVLVEGREAKRFSTKFPVANSENEVERLRAKQVAGITCARPSSVARLSTSGSPTPRPARPSCWTVSTSWPRPRSRSTSSPGTFSSA